MYNFVDVEASGLGIGSYPIEVGVALAGGKTRCTLVCPQNHWTHWDPQAEALHRVSREKLLLNGRSSLKVAIMLNEWLEGQTAYSDAWGNDSCWLSMLFDEAGVTQRFKVDSIVSLLTQHETEIWHSTKQKIIDELSICRHRASNDALILQKTMAAVREVTVAERMCSVTG